MIRLEQCRIHYSKRKKEKNKEEETRGPRGVYLALQKQTCQKLRKIQVNGLAIQGKTKNCMERNGGRRGCPPSAEDRNFATKRKK